MYVVARAQKEEELRELVMKKKVKSYHDGPGIAVIHPC
jgi:hypothetical protein